MEHPYEFGRTQNKSLGYRLRSCQIGRGSTTSLGSGKFRRKLDAFLSNEACMPDQAFDQTIKNFLQVVTLSETKKKDHEIFIQLCLDLLWPSVPRRLEVFAHEL